MIMSSYQQINPVLALHIVYPIFALYSAKLIGKADILKILFS